MIKNKKNLIYPLIGFIIIVGGYYLYSYITKDDTPSFSTGNKDSIFNSGEDEAGINVADPESGNTKISQNTGNTEEIIAKFNRIAAVSNLSELKGKEIYDIITILQQLSFDIDFFSESKFQNLTDFRKEIEVSEEDKGTSNPFSRKSSKSVSFSSSDENKNNVKNEESGSENETISLKQQ